MLWGYIGFSFPRLARSSRLTIYRQPAVPADVKKESVLGLFERAAAATEQNAAEWFSGKGTGWRALIDWEAIPPGAYFRYSRLITFRRQTEAE
jgi:hypothetical protein